MNPRIFVQIASYRDRECQWTVKDMYERARHPERVFAGICWQTFPEKDADCFEVETRPDQVRAVHFHASDSQGLGWARQQAQKLWRGEEYNLQIDSHMRFVDDWDVKMLDMLDACDSPKPALTVYPPGYTPPNDLQTDATPHVQNIKKLRGDGLLVYSAGPVPKGVPLDRPFPTAALAGGFLFGPASMIEDVPSDPEIYFNGEEPNLAVRLFTAGYDLFSPNEVVIYHYYVREESTRPWQDFSDHGPRLKVTSKRMKQLCDPENVRPGKEVDLGAYGLGSARSLRDYEEFAGVSFAGRILTAYAKAFPYVRSHEAIERLVRASDIAVSPQAHLFVIDQEGFLYTEARGELIHLNPTAALIWCALEDGDLLIAIRDRLVEAGLGEADAVEREVTTFIAHLQGQGALAGTELPPGGGIDTEDEPSPEDFDPDLYDASQERAETYMLLGRCFRVRYQDDSLHAPVHDLLAAWSAPAERQADHELLICHDPDRGFRGVHDDTLVIGTLEKDKLPRAIQFWMQSQILTARDPLAYIAGGLVDRDGHGTVVFGARDDDILLFKLMAMGHRLFSGTAATLARGDFACAPLPLALRLDDDHRAAVESDPGSLSTTTVYTDDDGRRMHLVVPPPGQVADADQTCQVQTLIFIERQENRSTWASPLSPGEAFHRLIDTAMLVPKPLSLAEVTRLIAKFETTHSYVVHVNNIDEAAIAIDALAV